MPRCARLGQDALAVQAAAVVAHLDDDVAAALAGVQAQRCRSAGLPAATRSSGVSRPWSIALRTRCVSGSEIFSIRPRSSSVRFAAKLQLHLLAQPRGQFAHHAAESARTRSRSAACGSPAPLPADCACGAPGRPGRCRPSARGLPSSAARLARQHGLGDHQFADQVHQQVDLLGGHADEASASRAAWRAPRQPRGALGMRHAGAASRTRRCRWRPSNASGETNRSTSRRCRPLRQRTASRQRPCRPRVNSAGSTKNSSSGRLRGAACGAHGALPPAAGGGCGALVLDGDQLRRAPPATARSAGRRLRLEHHARSARCRRRGCRPACR